MGFREPAQGSITEVGLFYSFAFRKKTKITEGTLSFAIFSNFSLVLLGTSVPVIQMWSIPLKCRQHLSLIFVNTSNIVFLPQSQQISWLYFSQGGWTKWCSHVCCFQVQAFVGTSAHLLHYSQHETVTLQSFAEDELMPHEKLQEMKMLLLQFLFLSHL